MKRTAGWGVAVLLAACSPGAPEAAAPAEGREDVLGLLTVLAEAPPIDPALVERALHMRLKAGKTESTGERTVLQGRIRVAAYDSAMRILLSGKLPSTPCVVSAGEVVDHAKALGYEVRFYDLGSKPMLTLTRAGVGGRSVGINVMTNPPTMPGERQACVSYISAGTEADDEQTIP